VFSAPWLPRGYCQGKRQKPNSLVQVALETRLIAEARTRRDPSGTASFEAQLRQFRHRGGPAGKRRIWWRLDELSQLLGTTHDDVCWSRENVDDALGQVPEIKAVVSGLVDSGTLRAQSTLRPYGSRGAGGGVGRISGRWTRRGCKT